MNQQKVKKTTDVEELVQHQQSSVSSGWTSWVLLGRDASQSSEDDCGAS
jgi:hypothetical protein